MQKLGHHELIILLISISSMLLLSRALAEIGKIWKLPVVMGELIAGIILGPTVFGILLPDLFHTVFPTEGPVSIALDGVVSLSVILLLFVAGMEVQLQLVLKQGRLALSTASFSMAIPFVIGFMAAWYLPDLFNFKSTGDSQLISSLFLGTALSISALPVIVRILMDMNLFKTPIGMLIIASAMFNDLLGWLIFSMILSLAGNEDAGVGPGYTLAYIMGFGLLMLTLGKKIINRLLPWMQNKLSWPGGVLSFSLGLCLLCAAFTQSINIHAILGAFIAGIAIGDSVHLHERAREIIHQFVTNFFAPLFFVSIGLKVNFIQNFDLPIVFMIIGLSYIGKISGASLGAWIGGMRDKRSLAVGFGLNARGAMEIILGTLALNAEIISPKVFVALVIMALLTSLTSGPFMKYFLKQ